MDEAREDIEVEQPITSNSGQKMSGSGRKRGHQHHIRHSGTRTSNVSAENVLAALRRGDQLPVTPNIQQYSGTERSTLEFSDIDMNVTEDENSSDSKLVCDTNEKAQCNEITDKNGNKNNANTNNDTRHITLIDDLNKNNRLGSPMLNNANILMDSTSEQLNKINVIKKDSDDLAELTMASETIGALNSDVEMELTKDELNDSISSNSSSGSKTQLKQSKRSKKQHDTTMTVADSGNGAKKEKRSRKTKNLPPAEERPPLEGADAEQWIENDNTVDLENDPEAAEWSKLRCTNERCEVVAEREYRRQNRRCADYPGLAFGRSIFSSDTMMKLNIIRNELHNIMKTQLKRVCLMTNQNAR